MSDIEMNALNETKRYSDATERTMVDQNEPRKAINAINWSFGLKIYHTAIPCFLAFLM